MTKEQSIKYLQNEQLMAIIDQKKATDKTRKKLIESINTLCSVNIDKRIIEAVEEKKLEYDKIAQNYQTVLENIWGIAWQKEAIIKNYMDKSEHDLPNEIKF